MVCKNITGVCENNDLAKLQFFHIGPCVFECNNAGVDFHLVVRGTLVAWQIQRLRHFVPIVSATIAAFVSVNID